MEKQKEVGLVIEFFSHITDQRKDFHKTFYPKKATFVIVCRLSPQLLATTSLKLRNNTPDVIIEKPGQPQHSKQKPNQNDLNLAMTMTIPSTNSSA